MTRRREVAGPADCRRASGCGRRQEVAAFLGVPVTTLHQWRYVREGPPTFKVGRHLRYDPDAVRRWLVEQCCPPDRCA